MSKLYSSSVQIISFNRLKRCSLDYQSGSIEYGLHNGGCITQRVEKVVRLKLKQSCLWSLSRCRDDTAHSITFSAKYVVNRVTDDDDFLFLELFSKYLLGPSVSKEREIHAVGRIAAESTKNKIGV